MKIRMLLKVGFRPIVLLKVYLVSKLHMQILKRDWLIIDYSPNQACVVKSNYVWGSQKNWKYEVHNMIMPIWIKTQNPYQKLAQHERLYHRVSNHHSSKSYKLGHFIVLFLYFHNVVVIILGFDLLFKLVYCGVEIE